MADDEPLILNLAGAILDGEAPDWASLESDASDSQRAAFAELQAIAAIGSISRQRPRLPRSRSWSPSAAAGSAPCIERGTHSSIVKWR